MKKIFSFFLVITGIFYGCSYFITQGMHDVIRSFEGFTLIRVVKESDASSFDKLHSGEAGHFLEFGADTCLVAEFKHNREKYIVESVLFLNQKGALGAFVITDIPGSTPVELGYRARKSKEVIQFIKGRYLVTVLPSKSGDIAGAYDLALGLAKRIRGSRIKPDIYEGLPQMNLVERSGFYFMGPKVFRERFSSELAGVLKLENAREGIAAKYRVDKKTVDFIKIRFNSREQSLEAVNSYLKFRSDFPIILPRETLQFYVIVEPDRSEVYVAEYGEWMYIMFGSPYGERGQELFEYILRGGK